MVRVARRKPRTKLAARRQGMRLSQKKVSELSGIPVRTIQRLERDDIDNPPIRYLVNLAQVLECRLEDVCEEKWLEWTVFDAAAPGPPPKGHWLPERDKERARQKEEEAARRAARRLR
ncbi:MAG TPA: helix-turn-helix transcriptional regulator [Solirubrobacterales bacterium]|nr:helix-turn-helix transcriptional regulator [Solirubrobacterales bacterium]